MFRIPSTVFPTMKYFVLAAVICLGISPFGSAVPKCHLEEVFACSDKAVDFINTLPRRSVPKTDDDIDKLCEAWDDGISCTNDYRDRCMTPLQRELLTLASEGAVDLRNKFCSSPATQIRTDYLTHAECLNKVSQGEGTNNNLQYLLAVSEKLLSLPNTQRLNFICCGYAKIYQSVRSESASTCGEDATKAGEELVSLAIAQLPNMLCSGFDGSSAECSKILPPDGAKPTDEFKDNAIYKYFYNLVKNYLE